MISWSKNENGTDIFVDGLKIGSAVAVAGACDTFVPVEEGVICWTRTVETETAEMAMRFEAAYTADFTMIPSVQYDQNRAFIKDYADVRIQHGAKEEKPMPTFFLGDRDEDGNPWRLIYHRSSVPGASYSEGTVGEKIAYVGMFLPPEQFGGAFSMYAEKTGEVQEMLWPEQDSLLKYFEDPETHIEAPKAMKVFRVMLAVGLTEDKRVRYDRLLAAAWKQYYTLKAPSRAPEQLWDLGVDYAKQLYTEEADGFKGFSIGFTWKGKWVKRDEQKYEIGWCGQNASFANSLLAYGKMTGDAEAITMAINVLDAWIAAQKPTGLIPTHYDDNMFTNGYGKTVDACNLGTAAIQFYEAYDRAKELGIDRPAYDEMADRICDFAVSVMNEDGRIGKSWLEADLSPAVKEGSTGAFLSMALCEGAVRKGREDWMDAAKKSCRYYIKELLTNGYTTAGALDILSIDKESSIPLLKGNLQLYRLTGEQEWLDNALRAAWYLSTWQWHYTRQYPEGSLLREMGYDTFGGTSVSIHGGMDPFALNYIHEIRDLAEITGDESWKQRANGIWREGQMCISDGDYVIDGKDPRPRGSQDEAIAVSLGNHFENCPSQWLVAWPTAFRLEALRRILPEDGDRRGRIF